MYLTNKQLMDIKAGRLDAQTLGQQLLAKYPSTEIANELAKHLIKTNGIPEDNRLVITKEEAQKLNGFFRIVESREALAKVKKTRAKVDYSPEEIAYKRAFMNEVIINCKGKTDAEKEAIKKAAAKKLAGLKAAADAAAAARKAK